MQVCLVPAPLFLQSIVNSCFFKKKKKFKEKENSDETVLSVVNG